MVVDNPWSMLEGGGVLTLAERSMDGVCRQRDPQPPDDTSMQRRYLRTPDDHRFTRYYLRPGGQWYLVRGESGYYVQIGVGQWRRDGAVLHLDGSYREVVSDVIPHDVSFHPEQRRLTPGKGEWEGYFVECDQDGRPLQTEASDEPDAAAEVDGPLWEPVGPPTPHEWDNAGFRMLSDPRLYAPQRVEDVDQGIADVQAMLAEERMQAEGN